MKTQVGTESKSLAVMVGSTRQPTADKLPAGGRMLTSPGSVWQTLWPLLMLVVSALCQSACSCQSTKVTSTNASSCVPQHERADVSAPLTTKVIVPGVTAYAFDVDAYGNPQISVPVNSPPARGSFTPAIELQYQGPSSDALAAYAFMDDARRLLVDTPAHVCMVIYYAEVST